MPIQLQLEAFSLSRLEIECQIPSDRPTLELKSVQSNFSYEVSTHISDRNRW